jgi:hypothetical protein
MKNTNKYEYSDSVTVMPVVWLQFRTRLFAVYSYTANADQRPRAN